RVGCILLDEDAALEREPGWHRVPRRRQLRVLRIRRRGPIEHVAVRVARIAVGAAERAADVRVDRPEAHSGRFRTVQHRPRDGADVVNVLLLADDRQRAPKDVRAEQGALLHAYCHRPPFRELRRRSLPKGYRKCKSRADQGPGATLTPTATPPPGWGRAKKLA